MFILIFFLLFFQTSDVPYKPKDEFAVNIDFQYKPRVQTPGSGSNQRVPINEAYLRPTKEYIGGRWPYLRFKTSFVTLNDQEKRIRIVNQDNAVILSRKLKKNDLIIIDAGFLDEIKDKINTMRYDILLLTDKKVAVSRIQILIDKDGTYFVNGTRFGKF